MVSCDEPVPARELLLQSKLSNAPFSELVASKLWEVALCWHLL